MVYERLVFIFHVVVLADPVCTPESKSKRVFGKMASIFTAHFNHHLPILSNSDLPCIALDCIMHMSDSELWE